MEIVLNITISKHITINMYEYNIIFPQIGKVYMNPISETEPTLLLTPEVDLDIMHMADAGFRFNKK